MKFQGVRREGLDSPSRVQNKATFQRSLVACEPVTFDFWSDLASAQCSMEREVPATTRQKSIWFGLKFLKSSREFVRLSNRKGKKKKIKRAQFPLLLKLNFPRQFQGWQKPQGAQSGAARVDPGSQEETPPALGLGRGAPRPLPSGLGVNLPIKGHKGTASQLRDFSPG